MTRQILLLLLLLLPCAAGASTPAVKAEASESSTANSPEAVIRKFLAALYSHDVDAYLESVLDSENAKSLIGTTELSSDDIAQIRAEAESAQLRLSSGFSLNGVAVATDSYPVGTKAAYMTGFRGTMLAIPVEKASGGWRVDVRFWLEMQRMQESRIEETDPRIAAKKFLFYALSNNLEQLNLVSLTAVSGSEVGVPNGLPGGDLDQILSLCLEMPIVKARAGEQFVLPSRQAVKQGASDDDVIYVGLMGPVELAFVLRKKDGAWKLVPQNYFLFLRAAGAI